MTLVGHGVVRREVLEVGALGMVESIVVLIRRYRCRACRAVIMVGPRGLLKRRHYSASTMALALARYAGGCSMASARASLRPTAAVGVAAVDGWVTLQRWVRDAGRGALFAMGPVDGGSTRHIAEHVTLALAARGGWRPGDDRVAAAVAGAAIVA